jgi:acetyl-CoA synthetase
MNTLWVNKPIETPVSTVRDEIHIQDIEAVLVAHPDVAEAVVVPINESGRTDMLYAFIRLREDADETDELRRELAEYVRMQLGPIRVPDTIYFERSEPGLPRTRSGKIDRRSLVDLMEMASD